MPNEYRVKLRRHDGQETVTIVRAFSEKEARREARYYHRELQVISVERVHR